MIENVAMVRPGRHRSVPVIAGPRPTWDSHAASYWPVQVPGNSSSTPGVEDKQDSPWPPIFALLALFMLVFAAGCAAYGWPLP
jgi:hypothetical protein